MSERFNTAGSSNSIDIFLEDSSSTTGAGLTGLVYNSAGLTCYYRKAGTGTVTAITLATQTVAGAWTSGGFVEVDATIMPGVYRFDMPGAITSTASIVTVYFKGATNLRPTPIRIDCRAVPSDVRQIVGYTTAASGAVTFPTGTLPLTTDIPSSATIATAVRDVSNASPAANSLGAGINATYVRTGEVFDVCDVTLTTVNETHADLAGVDLDVTAIVNRIGSFTGTGVNTVLGFLRAIMRTDATNPSDVGGTYDPSTDSLQSQQDGTETNVSVSSFTQAALDQLAAQTVTVTSPVITLDSDGNPVQIEVVQGADYNNTDGTAIPLSLTGTFPDWTSGTAYLDIAVGGVELSVTGTITDATGSTRACRFDLTDTQTATLTYAGTRDYDIGKFDLRVILSNADVTIPINQGRFVSRRRSI